MVTSTSPPLELCEFSCFGCSFVENLSRSGSGIHAEEGSLVVLDDLQCWSNGAIVYGGCISIFQITNINPEFHVIKTTLLVSNAYFYKNTAFERGGALSVLAFNPILELNITVRNSTFLENTAELVGGAFSLDSGLTEAVFEYVQVLNNTALNGGGFTIFCKRDKQLTVSNSTFDGNYAEG